MALTVVGVYIGMQYAVAMMSTGIHLFFLLAEIGLIFSARIWIDKTPLNYLLFGLFPILSGITITPYILYVLTGYANGASILLNAFSATAFMALASAVFARTTQWNLSVFSRALFFGLLGLIFLGILQIFVPSLRGTQFELILTGAGVILGFSGADIICV